MKKILISGFEPFGGETVNPSWEAVSALPDVINGYKICKILLPVTFNQAARKMIAAAEELSPDVILAIGQAGGRDAITPELVAINLRYATIPDNDGYQPKDERIIDGEANAHFSTLPMRRMAEAVSKEGIAARISYSAGAYVCNDLYYTLLSFFDGSGVRVGFIHVPYSDGQGKEPSMNMDRIVRGLTCAIENIDAASDEADKI